LTTTTTESRFYLFKLTGTSGMPYMEISSSSNMTFRKTPHQVEAAPACSLCGKKFDSIKDMKRHKALEHSY